MRIHVNTRSGAFDGQVTQESQGTEAQDQEEGQEEGRCHEATQEEPFAQGQEKGDEEAGSAAAGPMI